MTTSSRFPMAVHLLVVLARHEGDRVTSNVLAQSIGTNPVIVRRLLLALQRANLVDTTKGAAAGSRLHCSPRRIDLAQVYRAVEESDPFCIPSRKANPSCPIGSCIGPVLAGIIASAQQALERELRKVTIANILARL
jgi:Rrf2 family protein